MQKKMSTKSSSNSVNLLLLYFKEETTTFNFSSTFPFPLLCTSLLILHKVQLEIHNQFTIIAKKIQVFCSVSLLHCYIQPKLWFNNKFDLVQVQKEIRPFGWPDSDLVRVIGLSCMFSTSLHNLSQKGSWHYCTVGLIKFDTGPF